MAQWFLLHPAPVGTLPSPTNYWHQEESERIDRGLPPRTQKNTKGCTVALETPHVYSRAQLVEDKFGNLGTQDQLEEESGVLHDF